MSLKSIINSRPFKLANFWSSFGYGMTFFAFAWPMGVLHKIYDISGWLFTFMLAMAILSLYTMTKSYNELYND